MKNQKKILNLILFLINKFQIGNTVIDVRNVNHKLLEHRLNDSDIQSMVFEKKKNNK